jgi:UDP-2-acetamido-3-amino-2,3-dideoxy-glucuronate N-acetyltransferase
VLARRQPLHVDPWARIDASVALPDDVRIQAGACVPAGALIEAGCQIGPNVVLVEGAPITLKRGAQIGANATLMPGITIAAKAVVRPGSVVQRSVPAGAIVEGNPAAIVGYLGTSVGTSARASVGTSVGTTLSPAGPVHKLATPHTPRVETLSVRGVTLHHLPVIPDLRGSLTVGEFQRQIPFDPLRYFIVFGVPSREVRGEHAHRQCHQFLICLRGSCAVVADDGQARAEVLLDAPERGLYLPPMTWGIQYKYSPDAMLMVFASAHYDAADYIRDYDEFLATVADAEAA